MYDLAVRNGSVWREGRFQRLNVYVKDGVFACVSPEDYPARSNLNALNRLVLPGFIDPHVHFALNIGRTVSADDFLSGSRAAAYGGVTTFIDFLDPVDNPADLEAAFNRRRDEARFSSVDYKFHATLKNPKGRIPELVAKIRELGMTSVKIFTTYSDSGRRTFDPEIKELLRASDRYGFLVEVHVEDDEMIDLDPTRAAAYLPKSRPSRSETEEALKLAGFVRECGGTLYMVHLSSGETLEQLKHRYPDILNKRFFIESCPQYFLLNDELLAGKDGYLYTIAPPLRSEAERKQLCGLWEHVQTIGTDHCPFLSVEKNQRFLHDIPLGMGGVEHAFSLLYRLFGESVIDKMTKNSALLHRLSDRKGAIEPGLDADIVIFSPDPFSRIEWNHSRCDYDPYRGFDAGGIVESTLLRGKYVIKNGRFVEGDGKYLGGAPQ
jgi:dihydropyrimidinase